jgi:hypothetical protein
MASLEEAEGVKVERRGWWKSPSSKAAASERDCRPSDWRLSLFG